MPGYVANDHDAGMMHLVNDVLHHACNYYYYNSRFLIDMIMLGSLWLASIIAVYKVSSATIPLYCILLSLQMPPYIINFILTLLFKCLQDHDLHEKVDLSFIQSILVPILETTDSEGVVLVKMSLATCSSQQDKIKVNIEQQDVKVLHRMLKSMETAIEVLSFIEKVLEVDDSSTTMKSSDGVELVSCVLEWCEGNEDQETRAATLIELLLSV